MWVDPGVHATIAYRGVTTAGELGADRQPKSIFTLHRFISGVLEIVCAFTGREARDRVLDGLPEAGEGAGGGLAEQGLQLGEGLLDGIEVGAVVREIA